MIIQDSLVIYFIKIYKSKIVRIINFSQNKLIYTRVLD